MDMNVIREARNAAPFRPFRLHLSDGRVMAVVHPEFLAISPTGRALFVWYPEDGRERMAIVNSLLIVTLEFDEAGHPATGNGAGG